MVIIGNNMVPLCEVCNKHMTEEDGDLEDDVTIFSDCCERCGLCVRCREFGNHDCEDE
jgi:hypothetical protein